MQRYLITGWPGLVEFCGYDLQAGPVVHGGEVEQSVGDEHVLHGLRDQVRQQGGPLYSAVVDLKGWFQFFNR